MGGVAKCGVIWVWSGGQGWWSGMVGTLHHHATVQVQDGRFVPLATPEGKVTMEEVPPWKLENENYRRESEAAAAA